MILPIPRRQFVKVAAAAIATTQYPILGANDRIRIGQVGLGGRGPDHVNYYSSLDSDCQIVAICDVNQAARERGTAMNRKLKGYHPKEFDDMRKMFESKDIDAVSITTPNHWHALATIWACQAGKDVYVEKPACHNIYEGRKMVAAARKYNRMVQVGSQSRSIAHKIKAIKLLQRRRDRPGLSCARALLSPALFDRPHAGRARARRARLGPLPRARRRCKPYSKNKFAYNWHWFWDTGNGDIGNQGVHEMDICLWGLGRAGLAADRFPPRAASSFGRTTRKRPTRSKPRSTSATRR